MLKKEANQIVGGLSSSGQDALPINQPASSCMHRPARSWPRFPGPHVMDATHLKGRYNFKYTKIAMARRLAALSDSRWVRAMVTLMQGRTLLPLARLRRHPVSSWHLKRILEVCKQTPDTSHWLPTREAQLLALMDPDIIPTNLIIRLSSNEG